jgi:hypothetical protein
MAYVRHIGKSSKPAMLLSCAGLQGDSLQLHVSTLLQREDRAALLWQAARCAGAAAATLVYSTVLAAGWVTHGTSSCASRGCVEESHAMPPWP